MLLAMADDQNTAQGREIEEIIFDAELTPHRSLPGRGFILLMAIICVVSFAAGVVFIMVGAWPIMGFLGLDVLLIYLAFRINYRRGRMYETVRLTRRDLTVQRVDHWGQARTWRLPAYWLQVIMDDPPEHHSQLTVRSHGRSLTIGSFLTPEERAELADALRSAVRRAQQPALSS